MTLRLAHIGIERWAELNGFRIGHGAIGSLDDLPIGAFVDYVWWYVTQNVDPTEIEKFRARLWRPPKGEEPPPESPWSPESEMASFHALQASLSGG